MSATILDIGATEMATSERLPWACDFTPLLTPTADVIQAGTQTASLQNSATYQSVTLPDPPSLVGNVVSQIVRGSSLVEGQSYYLLFSITTQSGKVWTQRLTIRCDF